MSPSHPLLDQAESVQPSMQQNQSRSSPRPPKRRNTSPPFDIEDGFRDLSPATTLRTIFASSESALHLPRSEVKLMESIETASSVEKAFGKKVAESSKLLRIWCNEIEAWPWNDDFEVPQSEGDTENHETASRDLVDCLVDADSTSNNSFWGSLPAQQVVSYEERLDAVRDELADLDIEEQKTHVLHTHMQKGTSNLPHIPTDSPSGFGYVNLDRLTALITETILQALPYYSRLMSLMDMWSVRLAVLRQIPVFLKELDDAQKALDAAWIAIGARQDRISGRGMFIESLESIRNGLGEKLSILGQRIDTMLDMIEGCEETLPDKWIDLVEEFEIDYRSWTVAAQAKVHQYEHRQDQVNNPVKVGHQMSATTDTAAIETRGRIPGAWIDEGEEELLDSESDSLDESEIEDSDHATPKGDQATYHDLEQTTVTFVSRQRHDNHHTQHSTSQLRVPRPPLFPSTGSKSTTASSLLSASDPFADEDSWTDTNVGNHEWGAEEQYSQHSLRSSRTSFSSEDSLPTNMEAKLNEAMNPKLRIHEEKNGKTPVWLPGEVQASFDPMVTAFSHQYGGLDELNVVSHPTAIRSDLPSDQGAELRTPVARPLRSTTVNPYSDPISRPIPQNREVSATEIFQQSAVTESLTSGIRVGPADEHNLRVFRANLDVTGSELFVTPVHQPSMVNTLARYEDDRVSTSNADGNGKLKESQGFSKSNGASPPSIGTFRTSEIKQIDLNWSVHPASLSSNRRWRNTPGPLHIDLQDGTPAVGRTDSFPLPNRSSMVSRGIRESLVSLNKEKSSTSSDERANISFDNTEGLVCFSNRDSSCSSNRESLLSFSDSNRLLSGERESLLFTSYVRTSSVSNKQESLLYPGKPESTTFSEFTVDSDIPGSTIMTEEVRTIHLPTQEVEASAQLMLSTVKPKPNSIVVAPPSPPWEPSPAISTYTPYSPYTLGPYSSAGDQFHRQTYSSLTTMPVRLQFHKDTANDASGVLSEDGSLPFPLISQSTSPVVEKQLASDHSPMISHAPAIQQDDRTPKSNSESDIKLYLWTQPGRSTPIKLFVRLVGEHGNKVMVRVGGGWVDLGDYLHQYATPHERITVSDLGQQTLAEPLKPNWPRSLKLSTPDAQGLPHPSPPPEVANQPLSPMLLDVSNVLKSPRVPPIRSMTPSRGHRASNRGLSSLPRFDRDRSNSGSTRSPASVHSPAFTVDTTLPGYLLPDGSLISASQEIKPNLGTYSSPPLLVERRSKLHGLAIDPGLSFMEP